MYMRDKGLKYIYIYIEDRFGEVVGYIDDFPSQQEDLVQITIIATSNTSGWVAGQRGDSLMIDLRECIKWKMYDDHEKFCEEFFDAIL
jgi:hypothetical protein